MDQINYQKLFGMKPYTILSLLHCPTLSLLDFHREYI